MRPILKKVLLGLGGAVAALLIGGGGYAALSARAFDESMARVYDVKPLAIARSTDPAVIARGKHLVESVGACATRDCHGGDLSGGQPVPLGPLGTLVGPNITPAGMGQVYSDGELGRLLRHGVKKDGRSVSFMPAQDFAWLPDSDITAIVSYLRTVPPVEKPNGAMNIGVLGKVLDRRGQLVLDVARFIAARPAELAPPPAPTAAYGRFLAKLCTGCHGDGLSGGPIPGAPSSLPIPLNLTPHATGLAAWTYDDFTRLMREGTRKNGQKLNSFMPLDAVSRLDDTELRALWEHLRAVPAAPMGGR